MNLIPTLDANEAYKKTIPGKVQSYMAAGKPVIGAINGSCANFINNNYIGYSCGPNDSKALAKLIQNLNIVELQSIGKHSKTIYLQKYKKMFFINKLISVLEIMKH